jgi:hypothetical protein
MIERIPIFCVVVKDGEHWQVEAEWPGTIEEVHDLDEPEPVDEIAVVMRCTPEQAMTLGRHEAGAVPGTTVAQLDTLTISGLASPASQPIGDGTSTRRPEAVCVRGAAQRQRGRRAAALGSGREKGRFS